MMMTDSGTGGGTGVVDAGATVHLSLTLHRGDAGTPTPILVTVNAVDDLGVAITGLSIAVDIPGSTLAAVETAGVYNATVVPQISSGEIPITAHLVGQNDAGVQRTALVLPFLSSYWDQAEMLGGLVNTPGTEDSSTVSPDGQWLILGTYSPVDLLSCSFGSGGYVTLDANNPFCSTQLGPIAGPARPFMPGAERVVNGIVSSAVPLMCAVGADGGAVQIPELDGGTYPFALPPVSNYMFHRQADGTFAEPHLINTGSDGFVSQPFCYTFLGSGNAGDQVAFLFGFNVDDPDGGKPHPWYTQLTLGSDNAIFSYACPQGAHTPTFNPGAIAALPIGPPKQQAGNTTFAATPVGAYLLSDDESASPPYIEWSRELPDGGFTDWAPMALPDPTSDRRQPLYVSGRIYYYKDGDIVSIAWNGNTPTDPSVFSAPNVELSRGIPSGAAKEVVEVGQPTFAGSSDGGVEMYFVYYQRNDAGFDGQIGRVPLR